MVSCVLRLLVSCKVSWNGGTFSDHWKSESSVKHVCSSSPVNWRRRFGSPFAHKGRNASVASVFTLVLWYGYLYCTRRWRRVNGRPSQFGYNFGCRRRVRTWTDSMHTTEAPWNSKVWIRFWNTTPKISRLLHSQPGKCMLLFRDRGYFERPVLYGTLKRWGRRDGVEEMAYLSSVLTMSRMQDSWDGRCERKYIYCTL